MEEKVTLFELISIVLAFYAAILSTILMIRRIIENRKKLTIQLIYTTFYETLTLRISNKSKNPIIIQSISTGISGKEKIPINAMFERGTPEYPHKISSFDSWDNTLLFLTYMPFLDEKRITITVIDSEGDKFIKYSLYENNGKFSNFEKMKIRRKMK
jgi:hypothetical protein